MLVITSELCYNTFDNILKAGITLTFINSEILGQYIPPPMRYGLASAIPYAYSIADSAYSKIDHLANISGMDLIPLIRNKVLESVLMSRCNAGILPFIAEYSTNYRGYHFLLLRDDNLFITVSQVKNKNGVPRPAVFRNNAASDGQLTIDGISMDAEDDMLPEGLFYAIMTHCCYKNVLGTGPQFAQIAVPDEECKKWIADLKLPLLNELTGVSNIETSNEVNQITEEAIDLTLKEIKKEIL